MSSRRLCIPYRGQPAGIYRSECITQAPRRATRPGDSEGEEQLPQPPGLSAFTPGLRSTAIQHCGQPKLINAVALITRMFHLLEGKRAQGPAPPAAQTETKRRGIRRTEWPAM